MSTDELMIIKEGRTVPRKGHIAKRDVLADPIYNNKVVTKLINNIMLDGKKGSCSENTYTEHLSRIEEEAGKPALEVFEEAMNNIMPVLEVKARRIGGATYQVPIDVRPDRRQALALRWITTFSRKRGERTMEERLAKELLDASNNTGASVKKKEDMHKMAEANKDIRTLQILISRICSGALSRYASMLNLIGGKILGWKRISIRENQKYTDHGSY